MPEIPKDSSFVKELQYVHVVAVAFKNEEGKLELGVWGYHNPDDADRRFKRIMAMHEQAGENSTLFATETFMVGIYENFEQSLFTEGEPGKVM